MPFLSLETHHALSALSDPQLLLWRQAGFGLLARERLEQEAVQRHRYFDQVVRAHAHLPLEQATLLHRLPRTSPAARLEGL